MNEVFSKNAFHDKHIIISGGAGDIGMEIANAFAKAGAKRIALLDIDARGMSEAANKLKKIGCTSVIECEVDLADENEIKEAINKLYHEYTDWNVLATTAGLFVGGPLTEIKGDDWDRLMAVNARAVFLLSRLVAEKMMILGQGKIIHIGSSATYFGTPRNGAYAASKVVINQLTQTMAVEWGPHNIQVNTICPTVAETKFLNYVSGDISHKKLRETLKDKMPLKRLLLPSDIAPLVLFLASDSAQFINGAIIPIDGGTRLT